MTTNAFAQALARHKAAQAALLDAVPGPEDYPEHLCDEEGEALAELAFFSFMRKQTRRSGYGADVIARWNTLLILSSRLEPKVWVRMSALPVLMEPKFTDCSAFHESVLPVQRSSAEPLVTPFCLPERWMMLGYITMVSPKVHTMVPVM
jgi:hypothetical protein